MQLEREEAQFEEVQGEAATLSPPTDATSLLSLLSLPSPICSHSFGGGLATSSPNREWLPGASDKGGRSRDSKGSVASAVAAVVRAAVVCVAGCAVQIA
jgi:hypothetical protein